MIVYHGTTRRRALRICEVGFLPKKPSRRVWFAESHAYAMGRARTQARRAHDRPVVLTCNISVHQLRERLGRRRVFQRNRVIAVDAPVPVTVLRSHPSADSPTSPKELANWVNLLLGLKHYKGVRQNHPGIQRLSRWVVRRLRSQPNVTVKPAELVRMARQWLPEYFEGVEFDPERLKAYRKVQQIELAVEAPLPSIDPLEAEALECLESNRPARRARGLKLLARLKDPDLFDWCAMYLEGEAAEVCVSALRGMRQCLPDDPSIIVPYTESDDRRIRAAAIAALAKHGGKDALFWYERGLKDPEPCVRIETAKVLKHLDPKEHRKIFELARHDPNPEIAKLARKLTAHKGYAPLLSRAGPEGT
ncbi:MAG: hypothetical protein ACYTF6_11465 [Planctomycetota bacterium]|jgi:hypothetical protein